ncbi:Zn-ribbon domain-containing OB-fold protein [Enterovirga sp. CN4-39]|uniref:Zn-ribbon domain-containing OB-fold protein n=1 Tax=Enterovirga sp. CN4-39 TaxID=3400910 RepID=UPI003C03805B
MSGRENDGRAAEFRPFFAALQERRLAFPRCTSCTRFHWYPMKLCPSCRSADIGWEPVDGRGQLFSWTVVRHAFDPEGNAPDPPYVVGLVEFPDAQGIRLVTNLVETPVSALAIGLTVEPIFLAEKAGAWRVLFRAAKTEPP